MSQEMSLKIYTELEDNIFNSKEVSFSDIDKIFSLK